MRTIRSNITLPASTHDDLMNFCEELGEKKSHIISSALDRYFDYLDIKLSEKRLHDKSDKHIGMNDFFKELGANVQN